MSDTDLCRDVVGRRCVLVRNVETKRQRFPAGSVMDVRQTHRGTFSLYSEELGWVSRVSRRSFDVLPPVHSAAVAHCTGCWRTWHRVRDMPDESQCGECWGLVRASWATRPPRAKQDVSAAGAEEE